jgi:peptide/nickel transport system substrate-binding protein
VDVLLANGVEIDHQQALHRDAAAGRLREGSGPPLSIGFFSLLTDQPPLNNPLLRQALARSLDRATITQRVSLGMRPPLAMPHGLRMSLRPSIHRTIRTSG